VLRRCERLAKGFTPKAQIVIDTGDPLAGQLPIRALRLLREWTELHRAELQANWERAQARTPLASIDPLP
jgi:hypothetical protein